MSLILFFSLKIKEKVRSLLLANFAFQDAHHWEDWVELCCIANLDGEADVTGISDRLREDRDTRKEGDTEENGKVDDSSGEVDRAEEQDRHYQRVKEWFISLANRAQMLGDDYPFELNAENSKLKLRGTLTPAHRLYVALLMMANLHYFGSRIVVNVLALEFVSTTLETCTRQ